jgi:hypothetical protein
MTSHVPCLLAHYSLNATFPIVATTYTDVITVVHV